MLDSAILDKEDKKFIGNTGFKTAEELLAIVENAPVNILIADRDLRLTYMNPQSEKTLRTLEHLLPKPVDKLAGESIDIFHKDPAFQRKILANDKNLPHRAMIKLGDEVLDLEVTAVYDANKVYVGPMVTWEVATEKLKTAALVAQKDSIINGAPVNIMMANRDLKLVLLNPKSTETLKTLEQFLPKPVDQLVGESIDIFHKRPEVQRKILKDDSQLPYNQIIQVGPEKLDLLVSPTYDDKGEYSGPMVTWEVVTKKLEAELEMARKDALVTNAPVNLMMADKDFNLIYLNPKSKATLRTLEKFLPKPVDQLEGQKIDIFHKNPDHQRKLLADDRNLPYKAVIQVGPEKLDLLVSATYDLNNNYMGPMVNWEVITAKLELIENLESTSQTLASSSEELISTANSMLENSKNTSQGAVNASAAAEEVTAGITTVSSNTEEMKASIGEIARSSSEAANKSKLSLEQARGANAIITKLGDSSQEIGNVIKVISSIAQQTNLLALNATIEAARAGDAGKGFAVVANEVKELAKQTAKATEDITNKIQNIQTDSSDAVGAIAEISMAIEELNNISVSIAASIEEQTATTNEVARVVVESTNSVNQISEIIRNVSEGASQTQQGSEGTVTSAKDLQVMAQSLKELVDRIKSDDK